MLAVISLVMASVGLLGGLTAILALRHAPVTRPSHVRDLADALQRVDRRLTELDESYDRRMQTLAGSIASRRGSRKDELLEQLAAQLAPGGAPSAPAKSRWQIDYEASQSNGRVE